MKVLVTGSTGFLGGYLVEALLKAGHRPICACRQSSDTRIIDALGCPKVAFDLNDPDGFPSALDGADAVIHLAAYYTFTGRRELYESLNVKATENLVQACRDKGIRRFIFCSSTEAMGPVRTPPADESAELRPQYEYGRSKVRAEELVRASGLDWTILRPSGIYGPRNIDDVAYYFITTFGGLGTRFVIGSGRNLLQFVHVEDVVQGFLLALSKDTSIGQTYIISDRRAYTYEEIYAILATVLDRRPPSMHLPKMLAKILMAPIELSYKIAGKDNFMYRLATVDSVTSDRSYSIEKATRELGYCPSHGLTEGIKETVRWYRDNGYLSKE